MVVRVLRCFELVGMDVFKRGKEGRKSPFLNQHLCDGAADARGTAWGWGLASSGLLGEGGGLGCTCDVGTLTCFRHGVTRSREC